MKRVLLGLVVLVALLAVGAWYLLGSLDGFVEQAIEDTGSELLGTRVAVGAVEIDLGGGSATIRRLEIDNPTGEGLAFSKEPAITLEEITVAIDIDALSKSQGEGPIPLLLVRVAEPKVNAEVTPGGINLEILRKNVSSAPTGAESESIDAAGEPVRIRIDRFEFEKGLLKADTEAVGGNVNDVELPSMRLDKLGGSAGLTPAELGKRVLDTFLGRAIRQVARDQLSGEVEKQLDSVREKAAGALRSLLGVEKTDE